MLANVGKMLAGFVAFKQSYEKAKGIKKFLNFINFSKHLKKRLVTPTTPPQPTIANFEKNDIFEI